MPYPGRLPFRRTGKIGKSPADIIGFKKGSNFWHFALYQVKTSIDEQSLTSEIAEKETLPILAKLLKQIYPSSEQTKYYKNKPIYYDRLFRCLQ